MKRKFMIVIVFLSLIFLVGCNNKPNNGIKPGKTDINVALDAIVLSHIDLDNVVDDFNINSSSIDYEIAWTTKSSDVKIEKNKVIIKKILEGSYSFELNATIRNDKETKSKTFVITVKPNQKSVIQDVINKAKPYVEIVYYGHDNASSITRNINLPEVVDGVVMVSWSPSNSNVISPDKGVGYVTRGEEDVNVILIATLYYQGQLGGTVSFDVWVIAADK